MKFQKLLPLTFLFALFFTACKKEDSLQANNLVPTPPPAAPSANNFKDSALLYAKDIYLWSDKIPATMNAQTYADPGAIMTAIRQYSIEPGFTAAVDRWSFAVDQQKWNNISSGISADFGLNVFFRQDGDLRVRAVEKASPAGIAGIRRGWRITKINGSENMATSNASSIVQQVYQSSSTAFTFQKQDGSTVNLTLQAAQYKETPVVMDSVYAINGKKIGYFVFDSFLGDTTAIVNQFSNLFSRFSSEGVQELVVDLRYNGGGYVSIAEKLADYLAPSSANGDVMMTQKFNAKYTSYNSTERFRKKGSLNLNRIFFIVSGSTASASELLINSLKPYMDVVLLGPAKTHGKPAGYFPIPVGNWYILPVSFFTVNKTGSGNYYNGMALNYQVEDGLDKDWGDRAESCLASAINYITTGAFRMASPGSASAPQQNRAVITGNETLDATEFKGAIDVRGLK
jgi:C-terminal processing protease CtpA/Prc